MQSTASALRSAALVTRPRPEVGNVVCKVGNVMCSTRAACPSRRRGRFWLGTA